MLNEISHTLAGRNLNKPDLPIRTAIDLFQVFNASENKADATLYWYERVLGELFPPKGLVDPDRPIGEITEIELRQHISSIRQRERNGRRISPGAVETSVRALRSFFHWAFDEGYTHEHLLGRFRFKAPKTLIEPLTDDELDRLLRAVEQNPYFAFVAKILVDTGLRSSEFCNLKLDDVDLKRGVIFVREGKGAKDRMVPLGRTSVRVMLEWLKVHRPDSEYENVVVDLKGRPITRHHVQVIMRRLKSWARIPRLKAHLLRHTFATRYLENGGDALMLKAVLGHSSLVMTDRYVHLVSARAAATARGFSPLDGLG